MNWTPGMNRVLDIESTKIDGLLRVRLDVREDDRGFLYEVIHCIDRFVPNFLGQVYVVGDPVRGTVRAFHKHVILHDWFCIISGSAKFAFVDYHSEAQPIAIDSFVISARRPTLIVVPPGIYHGWMSLEDNTTLLSVASEIYDREKPDEVRVSPDAFDRYFGRSIWTIEAK